MFAFNCRSAVFLALSFFSAAAWSLGEERAVPKHLSEGEEFNLPLNKLLRAGEALFKANFTTQDGAGRPLSKGTGAELADASDPLVFPRNMNRVSGPDSNSCAGCHNQPLAGGGGDFVANVFVLGQRFDFVTFASDDTLPAKGAADETGVPATLQTIANSRNTPGMFGSGYIEMLARQMTQRLQALRDGLAPGQSVKLDIFGVDFGTLARRPDGAWDTAGVLGLPAPSLASKGPEAPPSLIILPFHQAGAVVSLRQFTNNALNHHHGMQAVERFGDNTDPDGDGVANELSRADVTALTLFQATLPVPCRVIPHDKAIEAAVAQGEDLFVKIGCADCHVPALPLLEGQAEYSEPNPYNPPGNLRLQEGAPTLGVDLNSPMLPLPRLTAQHKVTWVPAFTDLKLHDITSGPSDPNREPINMHFPPGSTEFRAGNSRFLTRKLWGVASEPPYYHHGQYSTLRAAVEAHAGESAAATARYAALPKAEQDALIEFLKTLRVSSAKTPALIVDEKGKPRSWRNFPYPGNQSIR
jgi:mono/diheme cytochrome c family protein